MEISQKVLTVISERDNIQKTGLSQNVTSGREEKGGNGMIFRVDKSQYERQGTSKAACIHDVYGARYWIPRSQVKVIDKEKSANPLVQNVTLTVEIADWIIRKNQIPVFKLEELQLIR